MKPVRRRRSPAAAILGLLRRLWLPLVVLAVVAVGAFSVTRIHGIFGSETTPSYNESGDNGGTVPVATSQLMRYEIFGPPGTVAEISYFNGDGDVEYARGVSLPWSLDFTITTAASIGSVAAQGNSDGIGCRITVDGVVKSEKFTEQVSAFTSCLLKAA